MSVRLVNEGLGPALIRTFVVSLDKRPQSRLRDLIVLIDPHGLGRSGTFSSLGGGTVIRAGDTFTLIRFTSPTLDVARAQASLRRADAAVCYCSLLANCWFLDTEPRAVPSCGASTAMIDY